MEQPQNSNVLIVGKRIPKVMEVEAILAKHYFNVHLASALLDFDEAFPRDHFNLIIVTDSSDRKPDKDFVVRLRKFFPQAKILGLFDKFNQKVEIAMRSAGVIFLGSYDYFSKHCPHILRSAFDSGEEIK